MTQLCNRIQEEAERQDRSLHSVLTKAGLGPSIFYKWQKGSRPRAKSVIAIAQVLGVAPQKLCPELSETFSALAEASTKSVDASGDDGDEVVFIGVTQRVLNHLRPILENAESRFIECSADVSKGLLGLVGTVTKGYTLAALPIGA